MPSLISLARSLNALNGLTTAQQATLPALIAAASNVVERFANRRFAGPSFDPETPGSDASLSCDEVLRPVAGRPDRGEPPYLRLSGFPVNSVDRVATGLVGALRITNADRTTNQRATAALTLAGDVDLGPRTTGLTLTRWASGVATASPLLWTNSATLTALAAAVNALGNGWSATLPDATYALWSPSELCLPTGSQGCLGAASATFRLFGSDLAGYEVAARIGHVYLPACGSGLGPFGYPSGLGFGDEGLGSGGGADAFSPACRVVYNAGWTTVPAAVQNAVALLVQDYYWDQQTANVYASETIGDYSYTLGKRLGLLPQNVLAELSAYVDVRV